MKRNLITYFLMMVLFAGIVQSAPRKDMPVGPQPMAVIKAQVPLQGNNIQSFFWNTGVFNQDNRTTNTPGFYWPKGTGKAAIFTTGLSICANYQGNLRASMGSYNGEYVPGYIDNQGLLVTSSIFKLYSVKSGDNQFTNPDFANWELMIPYGAPYVDIDSNGIYTLGVDIPGMKNAAQTIFLCMTDGDPSQHTSSEGFGGGSAPLLVQVALTGWCYISPGLEDLQFVRWVVINRSAVPYTQTYMSVVVDPDLGDATDDYIGCDTALDMAYCYNADNVDGTGTGVSYGNNPPSSGMDYFLSPIIPTGNSNDTVIYYDPPGSKNKIIKVGFRQLGLTSFVYFTNTGSPGPACENDPSSVTEAYNYMRGFKKDGTPWIDITNSLPTKFCYPGNPAISPPTGWTEFAGRVQNCGGAITGTNQIPAPPGDRRFIFNSGSETFTMNPNDTQQIILAQFVARGTSNLNAVQKLKGVDDAAQKIFNNNFQVLPPPPPPVVNVSVFPATTSLGTANIDLSWGDISEYYNYDDEIFLRGRFKFQGYEVYELRKDLSTVPDLNNMLESKTGLSLVAIFDKRGDTTGVLFDSLLNGQTALDSNNNEVPAFSWVPVVPSFGFSSPPHFPNEGLFRRITLTKTAFSDVNGGSENFIYGNTYKFIVIAYGYNKNGLRGGGKVIRNSLISQLITIVPEAPVAGTQYFLKNTDTLNTSRRDLGVMPIVINQELVKEAKYRILFYGPDTTYGIYRSLDGGNTYDILKSNLKYTNQYFNEKNNTYADDSARVIDGILWKVQRIRFLPGNPPGEYPGSAGVIKDPGILSRDSVQTRYKGWDYFPEQNNPYDSNTYKPSGRAFQSISMSISYPTRKTYIGLRSLLNPEDLRKVKIVFTGYGNGQQAYRYLAVSSSNFQYQDMREVPFKVYEIDPYDGTPTERQLNCGFLEVPGISENNKWEPTADTSRDVLYIFGSDYSPTPVPPYTTSNLSLQMPTIDVMYVWSPRLKTSSSNFSINDQFVIYPYTVTRTEVTPGNPLYYDIDTRAPIVANNQIAIDRGGLQDVKVVPNPYYGFNGLETSTSGRFVTFRNLPQQVNVKIYTLNGDLIKTLSKNDNTSTMRWDLNNQSSIPIASGIYIALLDAPGIGTRTLKIAVFTPEERIDF